MRRLLPASILVLALLLPAAASADSIVYTKNSDVWLARPDGSSARQLTHGGGYQSPTQANDGTILAQRGTRFVRLDRAGRTLATLDSVLTDAPAGVNAVGPFDRGSRRTGPSWRTGSGCTAPGTTTATTSSGTAPGR